MVFPVIEDCEENGRASPGQTNDPFVTFVPYQVTPPYPRLLGLPPVSVLEWPERFWMKVSPSRLPGRMYS